MAVIDYVRRGLPFIIVRRNAWHDLLGRLNEISDNVADIRRDIKTMALNTDRFNAVIDTISADVANLANAYTNAAASQIAAALQQGRDAQSNDDQAALDQAFGKLDALRQQLEANQPITPAPSTDGGANQASSDPVPSPATNATGDGSGTTGAAGGPGGPTT